MRKPLLILLCSCFFTIAYCQEFVYSFSGNLTINDLMQLKNALSQFPIETHNITLKPEQDSGNLFFSVDDLTIGEHLESFSLTDVKKTLIAFGLIPDQCNVIINIKNK